MAVVTAKPNEKQPAMVDRFLTIQPTPRVEKLRQRYLDTKDKVVIDILRIRTQVMQQTHGQPKATRQARVFAATVREMPINICTPATKEMLSKEA